MYDNPTPNETPTKKVVVTYRAVVLISREMEGQTRLKEAVEDFSLKISDYDLEKIESIEEVADVEVIDE